MSTKHTIKWDDPKDMFHLYWETLEAPPRDTVHLELVGVKIEEFYRTSDGQITITLAIPVETARRLGLIP